MQHFQSSDPLGTAISDTLGAGGEVRSCISLWGILALLACDNLLHVLSLLHFTEPPSTGHWLRCTDDCNAPYLSDGADKQYIKWEPTVICLTGHRQSGKIILHFQGNVDQQHKSLK